MRISDWSSDVCSSDLLGFAGAAEFRNWLAKFEISIMTGWQSDPTRGFCWLEASAYNFVVKDANGNWITNYQSVYAATFPSLAGQIGSASCRERVCQYV